MHVFIVFEVGFVDPHVAVAAFSKLAKAQAYALSLARDGRATEVVPLKVNEKVQKSND